LIHVGDTQIVITNEASGFPFCRTPSSGLACPDVIDGFDFKFTGENILGVTVDPSSSPAFLLASFGTHLGLQLISNNEIQVDVTGDLPLLNDQLVLDLSFVIPPPPTDAPEPATLGLVGSAIAGLTAIRRRRNR
jgi:hypothetical protein